MTCATNFVAGAVAPAVSSVRVVPGQVVAGGATSDVLVALRDAQNNPVVGVPFTPSVVGDGVTLGYTSGISGADGNRTTVVSGTLLGSKTLVVQVDGTSFATQFNVVAGAPLLAASSLVTAPTTALADGSQRPSLIVRLVDAFGNPVAGQQVTLRDAGFGTSAFLPSDGVTGADGTFTAQLSSTAVGVHDVVAQLAGGSLRADVTLVAGPPQAAQSALVALPSTAVADGVAGVVLTLAARDAAGNPVVGCPLTWQTSTGGAADDAYVTLGGQTATGSLGDLSTLMTAKVAGARRVRASCLGMDKAVDLQFVAGPAATATSSLTVSPNAALVASGAFQGNVHLQGRDSCGNAAVGQAYLLTTLAPGVQLTPATGVLDGNGDAYAQVSATVA